MSTVHPPIRRRKSYRWLLFGSLTSVVVVLFFFNLKVGTVNLGWKALMEAMEGGGNETQRMILQEIRFPGAMAALWAGAALAVGGLLMQTLFRNPLADPSILGVSSGAGLGVALLTLTGGKLLGFSLINSGFQGQLGIIAASFLGAMGVMLVILSFALRMQSATRLLILGVMIGYLSFSAISLLKFFSLSDDLKYYVVWGLGSFSAVSRNHLGILGSSVALALVASFFLVKPLNMLWLGETTAAALGLNVRRTRMNIIWVSGFLTAVVTAFCGPIAFIGLAVPHLARSLTASADHFVLIPLSALLGAGLALAVHLVSRLPIFGGALPVNALTALVGAPVVIVFLWKWRNL
ncbi:MAG: iron chelate uptake ABC transporter family permease subunit [Bacteroidales bacterium]